MNKISISIIYFRSTKPTIKNVLTSHLNSFVSEKEEERDLENEIETFSEEKCSENELFSLMNIEKMKLIYKRKGKSNFGIQKHL